MLRLAFVAFMLVATQAFRIQIRYDAPVLKVFLPKIDSDDVNNVVLEYALNGSTHRQMGVNTGDGWLLESKDVPIDGPVSIKAVAEVRYKNGKVYRTRPSSLRVDENGRDTPVHALPRQLRASNLVVLRDDFDTLDLTKWTQAVTMYGGMDGQFQMYTNDKQNIFVKNGYLYIKPTLTTSDSRFSSADFLNTGKINMRDVFGDCTNDMYQGCVRDGKDVILPPVMSGQMTSVASIKYGSVRVRARVSTGDWIWSSINMLPKDNKYGPQPKSGEFNIMENIGNADKKDGITKIRSNLHWAPEKGEKSTVRKRTWAASLSKHPSWADDFHIFDVTWTSNGIFFYVDGSVHSYISPQTNMFDLGGFKGDNPWKDGSKMAPFDQAFYLTLGVAVGGTNGYFPSSWEDKPWKDDSATAVDDFWKAHKKWSETWKGDDVALLIDYVEMSHF